MLQKISGHSVRVVAGTVALFVAHMNPLVHIPRQSIPIHARIVNDSGGKVHGSLLETGPLYVFIAVLDETADAKD